MLKYPNSQCVLLQTCIYPAFVLLLYRYRTYTRHIRDIYRTYTGHIYCRYKVKPELIALYLAFDTSINSNENRQAFACLFKVRFKGIGI